MTSRMSRMISPRVEMTNGFNATVFSAWCKEAGLPQPVFEYSIVPDRRWRWDIAWPDWKVAIEVQGGVWSRNGKGHARPSRVIKDMDKRNAATLWFWKVLEVTPQTLMRQRTIDMVKELMP